MEEGNKDKVQGMSRKFDSARSLVTLLSVFLAVILLIAFVTDSIGYFVPDEVAIALLVGQLTLTIGLGLQELYSNKQSETEFELERFFGQTESQLNAQAIIAVALMLIIGSLAIWISIQTIYTASDARQSSVQSEIALTKLRELENESGDLIELIATKEAIGSAGVGTFKTQLVEINSRIKEYDSSLLALKASDDGVTGSDGKIQASFLFEYFSILWVRIASIGILLFMFGVAFGHYRRTLHRASQYRELMLAYVLLKENIAPEDLSNLRSITQLNDVDPKVGKEAPELAFNSQTIDQVHGFMSKFDVRKNDEGK